MYLLHALFDKLHVFLDFLIITVLGLLQNTDHSSTLQVTFRKRTYLQHSKGDGNRSKGVQNLVQSSGIL